MVKKAWYEKKEIVTMFLVFFFPVGLYGLWRNSYFKQNTKLIVTGVIVAYVIILPFIIR
ncbi:MAG: hypothetical protein OEZ36_04665 [Spirochaetota bacterium]|nr:hypothetical protein [Spirochaetota bacterium]